MLLKKLKGLLASEVFWQEFSHPHASASNVQYYLKKFVGRVEDLLAIKKLSDSAREEFIVSMATRKLRISCMKYYDVASYKQQDIADGGAHLLSIAEAYEYIATLVGVSQEAIDEIHMNLCTEAGKRCVGLPYSYWVSSDDRSRKLGKTQSSD